MSRLEARSANLARPPPMERDRPADGCAIRQGKFAYAPTPPKPYLRAFAQNAVIAKNGTGFDDRGFRVS
jgi:hypothetical protein